MTPRELIDTAPIPGGDELKLYRRGGDHIIVLDRNELMNSRMSGSEEALASLAAERLAGRKGQRWLIGGYGMGFTLRRALGLVEQDAKVDLVELVPQIVEWARGPMAELTGACLDDTRLSLRLGDVGETIRGAQECYDAILLDVDNGPDGLVRAGNDGLYGAAGIAAARRALKPGGLVAYWSAAPDPAFTKRLKASGLAVEEQMVRARSNGKGPRHTIWLASRSKTR
ncbi:spermidine synthase [Novosphingopyxis iocasae]|uniref:spermine/spermidine synthase domain-containing protein n=1 Tax=Novosphingopyxis iocasae TaxID=2762729 RepID=UPI001650D5A3|nr:spermidine synthase [Novosphingopyxis iocasae]